MTLIANEIRSDYTITVEGVKITIKGVPTRFTQTPDSEQRGYSIGVALRLEELTSRALALNNEPGAIHELEF
jgi:hypothetical protein